ncbi:MULTISPECIES: response regulator [Rhizobium]|uniref:Oxygen regulatory protein nreC Nitrogen regulation protein C n=1 Tax=Rhizobium favelukesii TaxID=348824 RepID=W6S418_9HYPH|nr:MULTISPECIES: response regulator transcription factor [Rhizobium]MCS0462064.1 response regulator transcription factor [Rhizobium favelukesii]UFS85704.1 response regulator transcription factor [Rhizobium sp. T136]CDM61066.1 Oxygen regulatory protein nreC Nitrogen regulation protein C [Rhizobium favelukesii]
MTSASPIKVILIDNHPVVVVGLKGVLDTYQNIEVVGFAHDVTTSLPLIRERRPQVALVDINMPKINGIDAIALIRNESPETKVIMLSMHDSREYISSSIMRGAAGYILKDVATDEIVTAITKVAGGDTYFSSGVRDLLLDGRGQSVSLTGREQEIVVLIAAGKSNREIATELAISENTVETHRKHIKRKLGLSSTAELVRFVLEHPDLLIDLPTGG